MKRVKTALVGLGRIGWGYHLPSIAEHEGFELCAVVDVSEDRLAETKEKYDARGYTELDTMLAQEKPQLVVIASPTHLHREHAVQALRAGADVFLDKPMAPSYEDASAIADVAQACGRKLMIYQPHRAVPETVVLKRIFESGKLGEIYMIKRAVSSYERRNDWQTLKKFGGGMLNNYGAHYIDQMVYLTEDTVKSHYCRCHRVATLGDAEDVVKIVLEMTEGITVDIDINCATAYPIPAWMIFGKCGTVVYEGDGWVKGEFKVRYYNPKQVKERKVDESLAAAGRAYSTDAPLPWVEETYPVQQEEKIDFYAKCYEYFAEDKEPFVPIGETLNLMRLIQQMHAEQEA